MHGATMIETWKERQQKEALLQQVRAAHQRLQQLGPTLHGTPRSDFPMPTRAEVTKFLGEAAAVTPAPLDLKAFVVDKPYPPCAAALRDLTPIKKITKLLLETHHVGKALVLRRFGPVWSTAVGATYGAEDENGNTDFLIFDGYSFPGDDVIPPNAVFAVKQPYCKVDASGKPRVKLSHPSDIAVLNLQHDMVPLAWRLAGTEMEEKNSLGKHFTSESDVEELNLDNYDFTKIAAELSKARPRVELGSYLRRVEVRPSSGRGRGLFAKEFIKMGDIVIVEKATFVTFNHEPRAYTALKFDTGRNMITEDTCGAPYKDLARHLMIDNDARAKAADLYSGSVSAPSASKTFDDKPIIDIFHLHEVWQNNAIACPTPVDPASKAFPFRNTNSAECGSGLWVQTAYANHSCVPNVEKSVIGDLLVLRANRDIERCEEITISYGEYSSQEEKQQALSMTWGFRCQCELCQAEELTRPEVREKRQSLRVKTTEPLSDKITSATIAEAKSLLSELEATFELTDSTDEVIAQPDFAHLPRLPIAEGHSRLFALYQKLRDMDRAEECMSRVLNEVGLAVDLENSRLIPGGKLLLLDEATVLNVSILARLVKQRRQYKAAAFLDSLSEKLYLTLNGCMTGYEEVQKQVPEL